MINQLKHNGPTEVVHDGTILAVILPSGYSPPGIEFVTAPENSIQLAVMSHPSGHEISAHTHRSAERQVNYTQEVLVVRRGRVQVDLYGISGERAGSWELGGGDVILLLQGGHGFKALEDLDMVEIKQGPYLGADDKIHYHAESQANND